MKLEKHDHVVFKCNNPATGFVKRIAKDGSWADVQWHGGIDYIHVSRCETKHLIKTSKLLNRIATDSGILKVFLPEAYE